MSQNLTQPEEIDRILMAMVGRDIQAGVPILEMTQLKGAASGFVYDNAIEAAGFPHAARQRKKTGHGLPDA